MAEATIKKQPSNAFFKLLSDTALSAKNYANYIPVPMLGGAGDLLMGQAPELLQDMAYNGMSALGKGGNLQTYSFDPRLADVALTIPLLKSASNGIKSTTNALKKKPQSLLY